MTATTRGLARIAVFGGIFVVGSGFYFANRIKNNLKTTEYYKESFKILRSHKGIAHYVGTPIRDGKIDLGDTDNNYCTEKEAKLKVPVRGSQKRGTFYIYASRKETTDPWHLQRLELGFEDKPGERILVLNDPMPASVD